MASEKEKMISERMYYSFGPELLGERMAARKICEEFNRTTGDLRAHDGVGASALPNMPTLHDLIHVIIRSKQRG